MMFILKCLLAMYLFSLVLGCVAAIWRFFFDVLKWHDYEKKYNKDGLAAASAIADDINKHYAVYDVDEKGVNTSEINIDVSGDSSCAPSPDTE